MRPFTGLIYHHDVTPKSIKKRVHDMLFYNNPDCRVYKMIPGAVRAFYKDAFTAAKILEDMKTTELRIYLIPNHRYHKRILVIEEEITEDLIDITQKFNGEILEGSSDYLIIRFQTFFITAKALQIFHLKRFNAKFVKKSDIKGLLESLP